MINIVRGTCSYCNHGCGTEEAKYSTDRLFGYTNVPRASFIMCEVCAEKINKGFDKLIQSWINEDIKTFQS